ncbi:MAG: PD-(D/E)XK nuclease-like domain-containing protein, partial [Bdellovibrionota bacterium]
DFKSAEDASPEGFQRACDRYDYHRQAAWYVDGVQAITGKAPLFVFAVYETSSPFAAAFYYATPEMLREGRTENRALLLKYAHCLKENRWPGYSEEILPIDLPAYRTKRIQSKVEAY